MKRHSATLACGVFVVLLGVGAAVVGELPAAVEPRQPEASATCPVCGMKVAPFPEWIAQVVFADGRTLFFDGAKDLFKYLLERGRFVPDLEEAEIAAIFVTSYYDGTGIVAEEAFYVIGSDVHGPMGPELIPFGTVDEAEEFLRDHGGRRIVRLAEVTKEVLAALD
mgnify:CR=1 FL=1